MRKSQWETFNEETLLSYLEDLNSKNNPLFQKYAQMMKYNLAEEYEKIKDILEKASEEKNINLAIKNMDNLAKMQGFNDSNDVEEYYKNL